MKKKRFFAGIGLCCLALVFLILAVVSQDSSLPWLLYVFVAGMLASAAAGITLLINNLSCMLYGEAVKMDQKCQSQELQKLTSCGMHDMKQRLLNNGFITQDNNRFFKNEFSVLKDTVSYCISFAEGSQINDILKWQLDHVYCDLKQEKNLCFIIFAYIDELTKEVEQTIKDVNSNMIISETVMNPHTQMNLILIAVDKKNSEGWFVDIGNKHKSSLYAHGCRLIKKISSKTID